MEGGEGGGGEREGGEGGGGERGRGGGKGTDVCLTVARPMCTYAHVYI